MAGAAREGDLKRQTHGQRPVGIFLALFMPLFAFDTF
jgi:hypothetical protein